MVVAFGWAMWIVENKRLWVTVANSTYRSYDAIVEGENAILR
jgi:hypothetical protein